MIIDSGFFLRFGRVVVVVVVGIAISNDNKKPITTMLRPRHCHPMKQITEEEEQVKAKVSK